MDVRIPIIRNFNRNDIRAVSSLWLRVFAPERSSSLSSLERYFDEVFLGSPWSGSGLSSLVCQDEAGAIVGFLGVLPRRMRFCGQPITVAVASQFMVDPEKRLPFVSVALLRRLFNGPQDLTFSDGANRHALDVWEAAGGRRALLYCSVWTRVLRPAEYVVKLIAEHSRADSLIAATRPFCRALDSAASRLSLSPYRLPKRTRTRIQKASDAAVLLDRVRKCSTNRALQPEYDLPSFQWLLCKAEEQRKHGALQKEIVQNTRGEILGWYLYYVKPGGIGQVLQFGGNPRHIACVLDHLFQQAYEKGAVAVSGQLEPAFTRFLTDAHCTFTWSSSVVIQSRNDKVLAAIDRGDAFLSRLEGEWWMRFCDLHGAEA